MFKRIVLATTLWSAGLACLWAEAHPGHSHNQAAASSRSKSEATSPIRETFVAVSDGLLQLRRLTFPKKIASGSSGGWQKLAD
jgi:hypothetical protein